MCKRRRVQAAEAVATLRVLAASKALAGCGGVRVVGEEKGGVVAAHGGGVAHRPTVAQKLSCGLVGAFLHRRKSREGGGRRRTRLVAACDGMGNATNASVASYNCGCWETGRATMRVGVVRRQEQDVAAVWRAGCRRSRAPRAADSCGARLRTREWEWELLLRGQLVHGREERRRRKQEERRKKRWRRIQEERCEKNKKISKNAPAWSDGHVEEAATLRCSRWETSQKQAGVRARVVQSVADRKKYVHWHRYGGIGLLVVTVDQKRGRSVAGDLGVAGEARAGSGLSEVDGGGGEAALMAAALKHGGATQQQTNVSGGRGSRMGREGAHMRGSRVERRAEPKEKSASSEFEGGGVEGRRGGVRILGRCGNAGAALGMMGRRSVRAVQGRWGSAGMIRNGGPG
ncbi:hypothetical protein B0H19DRAFT_1230224 [Mycena capillaripes]|nr:hypothetical protein B0H19DRAFT_1230224 [Mycena capillaripes]